MKGSILYDGDSGAATMKVMVGGLPTNEEIAVNWLNNEVRGYVVASFSTDSTGFGRQPSLRLFRPGETRGAKLLLTAGNPQSTSVGVLQPCEG
jgi:hypothetical protein